MKLTVNQFDPLASVPAVLDVAPAVEATWPGPARVPVSPDLERLQRVKLWLEAGASRIEREIDARRKLEAELAQLRGQQALVRAGVSWSATVAALERIRQDTAGQAGAAPLVAAAEGMERERRQELLQEIEIYVHGPAEKGQVQP